MQRVGATSVAMGRSWESFIATDVAPTRYTSARSRRRLFQSWPGRGGRSPGSREEGDDLGEINIRYRSSTMAEPLADSPSKLIDLKIGKLTDWRGERLARFRALIKQADPE